MGSCCNTKRNFNGILEPDSNNLFIKLQSSIGPKTAHSLQVDYPYSHCNVLIWTKTAEEFSDLFKSSHYKVQISSAFSLTFNIIPYNSRTSSNPLSIDCLVFYINSDSDLQPIQDLLIKYANIPVKLIVTELRLTNFENAAVVPKGELSELWDYLFSQQNNLEKMLREIFDDIDKDHNNEINCLEFNEAMQKLDPGMSQDEVERLFGSIDVNKDEKICFNEFSYWWKRGRQLKGSVLEMTLGLAERISYFLPGMLRTKKKVGVNKRKVFKKIRFLLTPCDDTMFFAKVYLGKSAKREQLLSKAESILNLNIYEFWISITLSATSESSLIQRLRLIDNMLYYLKFSWLNSHLPNLPELAKTQVQMRNSEIWLGICFNLKNDSQNSILDQLTSLEKKLISPIDDYVSLTINSGLSIKQMMEQEKQSFLQSVESGSIEIESEHWAGYIQGSQDSPISQSIKSFLLLEGEQVLDPVNSDPFMPLLDYLKYIFSQYKKLTSCIPIVGEALSLDSTHIEEKLTIFMRFSNIGAEFQLAGQGLNHFINSL